MGHRAYQLNYTHDEDNVGYWGAFFSANGALLAFDDTLPSDLNDVIPLPCQPTTWPDYRNRCQDSSSEFEKMHDLDAMVRHMGSAALQEALFVYYGSTRGHSTYLPIRIMSPVRIKESAKKSETFIGLVGNVFQTFLQNMEGQLAFYIQADKQSRFIQLQDILSSDSMYEKAAEQWKWIATNGFHWYDIHVFDNDYMRKVKVRDADIQGLVAIWLYELMNWWLDELYMMFYDPTATTTWEEYETMGEMDIIFPSFSPVRWESEPFSEDWNNLGIVNQGWLRSDGERSGLKKVIPSEILRKLPEGYLETKQ